jgi:aldehyde:ferredoxin oxidoreductase
MMANGYMNQVLRVDLSTGLMTTQTFSEDVLRKYIGGSGLGTKILYEETDEHTDPLGPENPLIFLTGPIVGTKAVNSGRHHVVTRSPLTGILGESDSGGTFGPELKRAGYDGIIFKGKANKPVYLLVDNGHVELRDAAMLWGLDTYEVDEILKNEIGKDIVTCSIGIAGERLVRIASIMNDGVEGRAAGRTGVGAVMGSKMLKAIAVRGKQEVPVADPQGLSRILREHGKVMTKNSEGMGKHGTSGGLEGSEAIGNLPIRNWSQGNFAGAATINGVHMAKTILTKRYFCEKCVIGCGRTVEVKEGPFKTIEGGGPEYETCGLIGSNCLIDSIEAIAKANEMCNRLGLDTISTGSMIAFAMEAYERGIITREMAGGLEICWGDPHVLIAMIDKIGKREDIGYLLGEGPLITDETLGGVASEFSVHVKGLPFPAHDPRNAVGTGLQFATSARGACHLSSFTHDFEVDCTFPELGYPKSPDRWETKGKGRFISTFQNAMGMFDSLIFCKFIVYGLGDDKIKTMLETVNAVTGWDMTFEEFMLTGERIFNLKRMYNNRLGISRKDDILPPRIRSHRRGTGGAADNLPHIGYLLSEYYQERGWDEFGIPTRETLNRLGLLEDQKVLS